MSYPPYNDLLFEIYHYIPESHIHLLNKSSKRSRIINGRIKRYVYHKKYDNANDGLYEGCKTGDIGLVKLMIKRGANNWNWGLQGACQGGHMKFVRLMIKKGANNWDYGLYGACRGKSISMPNCPLDLGHMKIMKLMIKKGANNWYMGLYGACQGGHMNIVKLMIEKGANHWNVGLQSACFGGHMKIVKLMIEKGANHWNWGLEGACEGKGISIKLIAKINNWPFSMALPNCPLDLGHMKIVKLMIEKGATQCDHCHKSMQEHLLKK